RSVVVLGRGPRSSLARVIVVDRHGGLSVTHTLTLGEYSVLLWGFHSPKDNDHYRHDKSALRPLQQLPTQLIGATVCALLRYLANCNSCCLLRSQIVGSLRVVPL